MLFNMSNSVKILYKDFIKLFKHPIEKETIRNIKMFSFDVFNAYLTVMNIEHINVKNTYFNTQKENFYILCDKDTNKLTNLLNLIKNNKKKSRIVLMLEAEFIELNSVQQMKTIKFSQLFNNMTENKLKVAGLDTNLLTSQGFFK